MASKPQEDVERVCRVLKAKQFRYSSERELQDGLEDVFKDEKFEYERERELAPGDKIDFMLSGSVGVEVKIKGSPIEVARQLLRYAKCKDVTHIVLVTGKLRLGALPAELLGKPVTVIGLWESFL